MSYNKNFNLDLDDIDMIESALRLRLAQLVDEKLTSAKEIKQINELLGKIHNQKRWYRPGGLYAGYVGG